MTEHSASGTRAPVRSARRRLCASTLGLEALVACFAALTVQGLHPDRAPVAWAVAAGTVGLCILAAALLPRRVGYWLGSGVQVLLLASGPLIGAMYVLGVVFLALWIACLVLGARLDLPPGPAGLRRTACADDESSTTDAGSTGEPATGQPPGSPHPPAGG